MSLKVALLKIGNKCNAIPMGYAWRGKETYGTLKKLVLVWWMVLLWYLCSTCVENLWWRKSHFYSVGNVTSYTKYLCFIYKWDSRVKDKHCAQTWPSRKSLEPGYKYVINKFLLVSVDIITTITPFQVGIQKNYRESS